MTQMQDLADALKDTLRMLEAVRYTSGLGKKQLERIEAHKRVLARATETARSDQEAD